MAEEQTEEKAAPSKKSPMKLIILALVTVVVVGGAAAAFVLLRGDETEVVEEDTSDEEVVEIGEIVELEEFTVNLSDQSGQHYLRVKINLELDDPELATTIEERRPVIRDTILLLLSGLTLEDINTIEAKDELKEAIRQRVEQHLREGAVRRVLFVEFLVQ